MTRLAAHTSLCLSLLTVLVFAQRLVPGSFAEGVTVTPVGTEAVQRVALPPSVYATVTRPDLGDIRVFNAAGEVVPYALLTRPQEQISETLSLPLYPLPANSERIPPSLSVQIQQNDAGTQVGINSTDTNTGAASEGTNGYIIDARQLATSAQLRFDWQAAEPFVTEMQYQTSDDLSNWSAAGALGALADLEQGELSLRKDTLDLPRTADYLWLRAKSGALPLLTSVSAQTTKTAGAVALTFRDAPQLGVSDNVYLFDAGGYYQVQALRLTSQPNVLAKVTLESSNTLDGSTAGANWSHKYSGTFFNLTREGQTLRSPDLAIPPTRARYWRVTVDPVGGGFGAVAPSLSLGIVPDTLSFVARGSAPFTLAYGNINAEAESFDAQLLGTQGVAPGTLATTGAPFELAGAAALSQTDNVAWQQLVLWAVLIAGVALLGVLAFNLLKQKPATPSDAE